MEFLNGRYDSVLKMLEKKMMDASDAMDFEKAIEYRDLLDQRQGGGPEAEDHQQQYGGPRYHRDGEGRQGRGGAGLLRQGRHV